MSALGSSLKLGDRWQRYCPLGWDRTLMERLPVMRSVAGAGIFSGREGCVECDREEKQLGKRFGVKPEWKLQVFLAPNVVKEIAH